MSKLQSDYCNMMKAMRSISCILACFFSESRGASRPSFFVSQMRPTLVNINLKMGGVILALTKTGGHHSETRRHRERSETASPLS